MGSTWTTVAATVRLIFSDRFTAPAPALLVAPLVSTICDGSKAPGRMCPSTVSRPKKCGTPALLVVVREVLVEFWVLAESEMSICTVRMSPTRLARWSMKKARAPVRPRELAEAEGGERSRPALRDGSSTGPLAPG